MKDEALDKKAENARELGLDYEPNYKVTVVDDQHPKGVPLEQWGRPAPVQETVAWLYPEGLEALKAGKCWTAYGTKQDDNCNIPVYLNAAVAPKVEPVKTECDGFDSHPAAPVQEPVAWQVNGSSMVVREDWIERLHWCFEYVATGRAVPDSWVPVLYTTPPAAQRPLIWLSQEEEREIKDHCTTVACVLRAVKAKLKGKNT
jgi:hypothetical protein